MTPELQSAISDGVMRYSRGKPVFSPQHRFWNMVNKGADGGCWVWTGSIMKSGGYGQLNVDGKPVRAHCFSWRIHNGEIPNGLCVLHKCDNPPCVNPAHLFLGTRYDNANDMKEKRRAGSPNSKLTMAQVDTIKTLYPGLSQSEIGERFGIDQSAVSLIVNNKTYQHSNYAKSSC